MQLDLPTPAPDALAHSDLLAERLREVIRAAGGWISFADFMQQILYMPGYGYYSAGALKFGEGGDFVTAPEISPLFSQCVAGQIAQVLRASGGGTVLEPGAGTGVMAADVLLELQRLDAVVGHGGPSGSAQPASSIRGCTSGRRPSTCRWCNWRHTPGSA